MKKTAYISQRSDLFNIALEFLNRVLRREKLKESRLQMNQNYIFVDYITQYMENSAQMNYN